MIPPHNPRQMVCIKYIDVCQLWWRDETVGLIAQKCEAITQSIGQWNTYEGLWLFTVTHCAQNEF